jgi:hypothetical protein
VPCLGVDNAGAFIEMNLEGRTADVREVALELIVPGNIVRIIVSARSDGEFGFYKRDKPMVVPVTPAPPIDAAADAAAQDAKPGA